MVRSITDAAIVLSVIAGKDPNDNYTLVQPAVIPDYMKALKTTALRGKRIGVPRIVFTDDNSTGNDPYVNIAFNKSLDIIRGLGATVVDPADLPSALEIVKSNNETVVLNVDFKVQLDAYYRSLVKNPSGVRSLADLIVYNDAHPALEEPTNYTDQSMYVGNFLTFVFPSSHYFQSDRVPSHDRAQCGILQSPGV